MPVAKIGKEIVVETEDRVGMLAEVTGAVASAGVNIQAVCAYGMQGKAVFMLITDNNKKAVSSLESKGYKVREDDVVVVDLVNKVGTASKMATKLKDAGINLSYIYGSTGSAAEALLVFASNDNAKAVAALNKK